MMAQASLLSFFAKKDGKGSSPAAPSTGAQGDEKPDQSEAKPELEVPSQGKRRQSAVSPSSDDDVEPRVSAKKRVKKGSLVTSARKSVSPKKKAAASVDVDSPVGNRKAGKRRAVIESSSDEESPPAKEKTVSPHPDKEKTVSPHPDKETREEKMEVATPAEESEVPGAAETTASCDAPATSADSETSSRRERRHSSSSGTDSEARRKIRRRRVVSCKEDSDDDNEHEKKAKDSKVKDRAVVADAKESPPEEQPATAVKKSTTPSKKRSRKAVPCKDTSADSKEEVAGGGEEDVPAEEKLTSPSSAKKKRAPGRPRGSKPKTEDLTPKKKKKVEEEKKSGEIAAEDEADDESSEKKVVAKKTKSVKSARGRSRGGGSLLLRKIASIGKKPTAEQSKVVTSPDKVVTSPDKSEAPAGVGGEETADDTETEGGEKQHDESQIKEEQEASENDKQTEEEEAMDIEECDQADKEEGVDTEDADNIKPDAGDATSESPAQHESEDQSKKPVAAKKKKSVGFDMSVKTEKPLSPPTAEAAEAQTASTTSSSQMPMPAIASCSPKKRIPLSFFSPKAGSSQTATKAASTAGGSTTDDETSVRPQAYNPAKANYHPVKDACWTAESKNVPYLALARTLCIIEDTSARLKITSILCNFFRSVIALAPDQLLPCVYLCLNELGPAHEGLELGIGESIVMKAITMATGRSLQALKSQMVDLGDLGLLAEKSRGKQSMMYVPAALTVKKVFSQLKDIAQMTGTKSQQKKIEKINSLLVAGRDCEPRYIARSLTGKLRIGLAEQTLLTALAHSVVYTPPSSESPLLVVDASKGVNAEKFKSSLDAAALILKSTQSELPNYDNIISALLEHGLEALPDHCKMTPGIPLKPMLAHPTKEIAEVLRRFEGCDFTCEYKYDGERAQIHLVEGGKIHIYSRNREDNTSKYPDIIARIPKLVKEGVESFVIDTEAVAWDVAKKEIQPFQVLSTRKRKDADASEIKVQVCTFAFDLLYLNGKSYVKEPFRVRRQALHDSFNTVEGEFMFVTQRDCTEPDQIEEFLDLSIQGNCEGLMVKTLDVEATYEIAKRSHNWLKVKKDYLEGMGDSLDLVVVGGYHGAGKRQGVFGAFLLACYNSDSEQYETVCKIGTGLKDTELTKHTEFFKDHHLQAAKSYYSHGAGAQQPDVWFDAVQVWEVKAADFTISPVYTAGSGLVDAGKGISMRFPRFIRIRDDKKPEDATSSEQMADMYSNQMNKKSSHSKSANDEAEFY